MTLLSLYDLAAENKIDVYYYPLRHMKSISTPEAIGVDVDMLSSSREEKECLAHELGHCMTGSFYRVNTLETRGRMEERANRWAYKTVLPLSELQEALQNGITEPWELAEYFELPQKFIEKALCYYKSQSA